MACPLVFVALNSCGVKGGDDIPVHANSTARLLLHTMISNALSLAVPHEPNRIDGITSEELFFPENFTRMTNSRRCP